MLEPISLSVGIAIGLPVGALIGYIIWHRRHTNKAGEKRLTQLQVASLLVLVMYLASPLVGLPKPDPIIVISILALVSGEAVGASFAKVLERYTSIEPAKKRRRR